MSQNGVSKPSNDATKPLGEKTFAKKQNTRYNGNSNSAKGVTNTMKPSIMNAVYCKPTELGLCWQANISTSESTNSNEESANTLLPFAKSRIATMHR